MTKSKKRKLVESAFLKVQHGTITSSQLQAMFGSEWLDIFTDAWKLGEVFVSQVTRTELGYIPTSDCNWSKERESDFVGHDDILGAYRITQHQTNPFTVKLEATLSLSLSGVCLTLAPDRKHCAIGDQTGAIFVCNIDDCSIAYTMRGTNSRTWTLAYSPDGQFLVSGHQNGAIIIWKQTQVISQFDAVDWVRSLSFSSDGQQFLSSHSARAKTGNPLLRLWTISPLNHVKSYLHFDKLQWNIRCLPDREGFVVGGKDKSVIGMMFNHDDPLFIEPKQTATITCLAMHPMGGIVASGAWNGIVKIVDLETGADLRSIDAHGLRMYSIAISPSGKILATGSKDSQIALWKLPECLQLRRFEAHDGWVKGLEFSNEDTLISVGTEGTCKIWRLKYRFPQNAPVILKKSATEVRNEYIGSSDEDDE